MAGEQLDRSELLALTSEIVSSHVSNNAVSQQDLTTMIGTVFQALSDLAAPQEEPAEELKPAVAVKKSIFDDHIVCLEDGKKLKMLKRHLKTAYDMTPEEYRAKWDLPRIIRWLRRLTRANVRSLRSATASAANGSPDPAHCGNRPSRLKGGAPHLGARRFSMR